MRAFLAFMILGVSILAGCGPRDARERGPVSAENPLRVVATTSILGDVVREVGGDLVDVQALMGPGIDPHLYKASEGDVVRMSSADVVFYNGLHLEGKMVEIFEQMHERGLPVYAATNAIAPDSLLQSALFTGNFDPHIWFDVLLWEQAVHYVGERLAGLDEENAAYYRERAATYGRVLADLDAEVNEALAVIPAEFRVLITSHDAFGYFGRAYGFDVRGLQGISTATEAGTGDVQELAAFVSDRRIPAMFVESSISPRGIQAVREAVRDRGFEVRIGGTLYGDALGPAGSPADTYIGMVRTNVSTIIAGLHE
ncbi:MAG: zinc ABC transporter substrate-binding protein [Rhodothermales bacterium]